MNRKQIVDLITAIILILVGSALLIFPILEVINVKIIFMAVLSIYGIMNLVQFLLTRKSKDYEGLFTMIASVIVLVIVANLNVGKVPWYLAIALFTWIILMALIKLKKAGLLTTINLYYPNDIQILVLGFFYLIHGILELLDPLAVYLLEKK